MKISHIATYNALYMCLKKKLTKLSGSATIAFDGGLSSTISPFVTVRKYQFKSL